jgi:UDP-N-acetylglucosamine--N-acetylmuramyl-(pentapeptide) pyrophosphoryl-undecaprenol N-acetylglucosamine transferase
MHGGRTKTLRIVVAGGGTGGHVYPGIAVVQALRELERTEPLFVGARGGVEQRILEAASLEHELLPGYGLRGAPPARRVAAPAVFGAGVIRALALLRAFRPDVVLGTGGYASAAVVAASVLARVPRVLQEQNSVPGLVNRRLSRFADLVLLSYGGSHARLSRGAPWRVVGNPIRRMPRPSREDAARFFGLDPARATVLVMGGSRGARSLNLAGADAAALLLAALDVQFVILAGRGDRAEVERRTSSSPGVRVLDYLDEVHHAYALCDVAVARAGASSVFELALFGVPAIFVPYPYAADAHQESNAAPLVAAGAALSVRDAELSGPRLAATIESLLRSPERRASMSLAMREWARPNAAAEAARAVLEVAGRKRGATPVEPRAVARAA